MTQHYVLSNTEIHVWLRIIWFPIQKFTSNPRLHGFQYIDPCPIKGYAISNTEIRVLLRATRSFLIRKSIFFWRLRGFLIRRSMFYWRLCGFLVRKSMFNQSSGTDPYFQHKKKKKTFFLLTLNTYNLSSYSITLIKRKFK